MSTKKCVRALVGLAALGLAAPQAMAQPQPRTFMPPISEYQQPIDYPNANQAAVAEHFNRAREIAGDDLYVYFNTLGICDQLYKGRTNGVQYEGIVPSQKIFDNLYYVGQMSVSAWAINTSDGIVLIDALDNIAEAREIIAAGLVKVGLDPKNVKYVIITHEHGDHYGGAQYFRDSFGSVLVASRVAWDAMALPPTNPKFDLPPKRGAKDISVDGEMVLKVGGEEIHMVLTPGHAAGVLSLYFKVTDNGEPHVAGLYGGIGLPRGTEMERAQIQSFTRWMEVTKAVGVDAAIGNHPLHFDGPAKLELLRYRRSGDKHPFVLGVGTYQRYSDLQRECIRLLMARQGVAP
jgi:metallo-beta-lactamase class B